MGAHAAGELASQIATDTIPHSYRKQPAESPSEALIAAVKSANEAIYTKGQEYDRLSGHGHDLQLPPAAAVWCDSQPTWATAAIYRLRANQFEQLTFDHSLVWEMAKEGQATEDEVPSYVPKNVITRSLGPHPTVAVDIEGPVPAGQR